MPGYNGVSLMPISDWSTPDAVLASDASLSGCGAWFQGSYFHSEFPSFIQRMCLHINALELLTIVVSLKLWGHLFRGLRIKLFCDNQTSVCVINTGRSRDKFLQACLREICFIAGRFDFEIRAVHLSGVSNRLPDLLSHWGEARNRHEFAVRTCNVSTVEYSVSQELFLFSHEW